jgi:hypothetical protein
MAGAYNIELFDVLDTDLSLLLLVDVIAQHSRDFHECSAARVSQSNPVKTEISRRPQYCMQLLQYHK